MFSNVICPACLHKYWLPEGEMRSRQTCPKCQAPFFAGASVAGARPAAPSAEVQAGYAKTMVGESAPPIKYNCPRCKAPLEAPASEAGTKQNCPNCTQRLQVPAAPKLEPAAASPKLDKTMLASDESAAPPRPPIKYNCPNCKKPLESPADQGGTKKNCPYCSQRLQIPAAPPVASNRDKTMLASDESAAPARTSPGAFTADGVRGSIPVAAAQAPPVNPWAAALTPRNVFLGVVVLLLLLLVVPAVIRGGKVEDKEALAKAQLELEKLKAEIELKKREMDLQSKAEAEARKKIDEMMQENKKKDEEFRAERKRLLDAIEDEAKKAALKKKLDDDSKQQEADRLAMEKKYELALAELKQKQEETRKALEASQKTQQTIIQQPPPVIYYPPYHPRYYWPWW
jgi:DNA-directed RNA polymerase subunit RPC12/RpoP